MASKKRSYSKQKKSLKKLQSNFQFQLGLLLITIGAILLIWSSFHSTPFQITTNRSAVQSQIQTSDASAKPAKLYIPRIKRSLSVSDGHSQNNRWIISPTGVSFYTGSALPGQGNTVIYGHNTQDVLGGLWRVQDGDTIYLILQNGDFVKYQVFERKEIKPTQVEILNNTNDSRLTIYTCSGFLDTARFVLVAKSIAI